MPKLLWGIHKITNNRVPIQEVEDNGFACNCVCPGCGENLVARTLGKINQPHFAHPGKKNCKYLGETILHRLAKEIFLECNYVMLDEGIKFNYTKADIEYVEGDRRIDVRLFDEHTGRKVAIEIVVTHELNEQKIATLLSLEYEVVEIYLKHFDYNISKEELRQIIINETDTKFLHEKTINERVNSNWERTISETATGVSGQIWEALQYIVLCILAFFFLRAILKSFSRK